MSFEKFVPNTPDKPVDLDLSPEERRLRQNEELEDKQRKLEKEIAVIRRMVDEIDTQRATTLATKKPGTNVDTIIAALDAEKKKLEDREASVQESLDALFRQMAERVDTRTVMHKET